jgi:perosamine synthetase
MKNGTTVSAFERAFADYVGARYAIACANGTVTLQAALVALGIQPGDRVAVPPLTMSATTIAVLNVGARPVFRDVDPRTWLMRPTPEDMTILPVDLYGLNVRSGSMFYRDAKRRRAVYDSAQTLYRTGKYDGSYHSQMRSYSLQASKILSTGEGGMLVTDDEERASAARSYLSLGYAMRADQARIDPAALKASDFVRHVRYPAINGRINDCTAALGLERLAHADALLTDRAVAASLYADAVAGCDWLTPQYVPEGWTHDYWTYAVACDTPERARWLQDAVVQHGGERPYGAWRLTYREPAFSYLSLDSYFDGVLKVPGAYCPIAESLQPRLLQFQTNDLVSAQRNARALAAAIREPK